ncbi:STAS domain-containing protein [Psychromonas sp. Urea-02u-13]|uniref:STAS domain-containing protein n=1 Tax=Psychromonas sp. Urea-02u-13 TaxID=2058326 RepID=UPI000C32E98C|nr:STAS domain-containing protein [Psychromonas sp. Urea-02u-13]PKG37916.1 anti-sigma-factor [Psychromonas sp. Urea-02u-13]
MNIKQVNSSNEHLVIILTGEMDADGCSKIRPDLEAVTQQTQIHIVLDISGISFIDSSGIGAIVFLFKRLKEQQRTMGIIGVQGQPKELMTLLRIDSAIPLNSGHDQELASCV